MNRMSLTTSDSDGTIARVEIFVNGVLQNTVVPNVKTYSGYVDFSRNTTFLVKVVSTDNVGAKTERSITVR